jgi:hypothetical protein
MWEAAEESFALLVNGGHGSVIGRSAVVRICEH